MKIDMNINVVYFSLEGKPLFNGSYKPEEIGENLNYPGDVISRFSVLRDDEALPEMDGSKYHILLTIVTNQSKITRLIPYSITAIQKKQLEGIHSNINKVIAELNEVEKMFIPIEEIKEWVIVFPSGYGTLGIYRGKTKDEALESCKLIWQKYKSEPFEKFEFTEHNNKQ